LEEEKLSEPGPTSDRFSGIIGKAVRTRANLLMFAENSLIPYQNIVFTGGKIHLKILFIPTLSGGY